MSKTFKGSGKLEDPYQITNYEQLDNIRNNLKAHFKLMNDINLSEHKNFNPIGSEKNPFLGVFDGNGHIISNMKISTTKNFNIGLFGFNKGEIKNIKLENANLSINISINNSDEINYEKIKNLYLKGDIDEFRGLYKNTLNSVKKSLEMIIKDSTQVKNFDGSQCSNTVGGYSWN